MSESTFLDRSGQPLSAASFDERFADPAYRFLRRESVGGYVVVTAWLGVDQSRGDAPEPLIFGTVAIDESDELLEGREEWRPTEVEALANHEALVAHLRAQRQR